MIYLSFITNNNLLTIYYNTNKRFIFQLKFKIYIDKND